MNAFPDDFISHNLPLIVLSGLGDGPDDKNVGENTRTLLSEGGFRIKTDIPIVTGKTAQALLQTLLSFDSSNQPWHGRVQSQAEQSRAFRVLATGRTFTLPPRKAPPPAHSPRLRPTLDGTSPPPQLVLHSPISPLTPSSPLYPDGLMTPLWITKHQSHLPAIFLSFFTLISDPDASTLQDNKLKSEIYNIRSVITSTNYKTKFVVVLVSDGDIDDASVEERLTNIRKAANLDNKSLFFIASGSSQQEIVNFSTDMLNGLYSSCIEYYRDLSKHARRKRNRNIVPQPTIQPSSGTSRTLPLAGWNVRYELKLGVFAEFRQEMEAAVRNYETAYANLFGAEVFESIPSWSPRFNEARMLSDVIAIRIIRCLLWLGQTTTAVKSWVNHRDCIGSLVDRRGTGTETYGWEAWQNIWSKTMAQLIYRAQALGTAEGKGAESVMPVFIPPESALSAIQRFSPWENLHHEGYWLNIAQRHTQVRRDRALLIPEEDRNPPGQSPASLIASKAHLYDKYLALEPYKEFSLDEQSGFDYSRDIIETLELAISHFSNRSQTRMAEMLQLKKAMELRRGDSWKDAISILEAIWDNDSWRREGWWTLLQHIGENLMGCAVQLEDEQLIAKLLWQLNHPLFSQRSLEDEHARQEGQVTGDHVKLRTALALGSEKVVTRLAATVAFAAAEGHVGEDMGIQITLNHLALERVPPLQLSLLKVVFEGGMRPIYLVAGQANKACNDSEAITIFDVRLQDAQATPIAKRRLSIGAVSGVVADVDLSISSGKTKVFETRVVPREAGDISVASISMTFTTSEGEITIATQGTSDGYGQWWEMRNGKPISRPYGRDRDPGTVKVLPKPPKLDIVIPELRKAFYTNESIELTSQCTNHEDQTVLGLIEARLISPGKTSAALQWKGGAAAEVETVSDDSTSVQRLSAQGIGEVEVSGVTHHPILITNVDEPINHELEIVVIYALQSNPETKLFKSFVVDIPVIRPFEANFSFHSRYHDEAWPSFFSPSTVSQNTGQAVGVKQQYLITAVICSFAIEDITIISTSLKTQKIVGGAVCSITPGKLRQSAGEKQDDPTSATIRREENKRFGFDMTLQKLVLGDRQPVAIDVTLEIKWKRGGSDQLNTSLLQAPRFLAPTAEPRVLLQTSKENGISSLHRLIYTIENPSLHFLTFNMTMETSDDFAFSGSKFQSFSLVPLSRHNVVYRILSNKAKAWVRVHLEVVDAYFGHTLKIQPAMEGIRVDKQGNVLVWVD